MWPAPLALRRASQEISSIHSLNNYWLTLLKFRVLIVLFARPVFLGFRNSARAWPVQPILVNSFAKVYPYCWASIYAPTPFDLSHKWIFFFFFSWTAVYLSQEVSGWLKSHIRIKAWECDASCSWSKTSWTGCPDQVAHSGPQPHRVLLLILHFHPQALSLFVAALPSLCIP